MSSFTQRMIGAARLDVATYNEVERDLTATPQAVLVVVLASVAGGVGAGARGAVGLLAGTVVALIAWAAWAAVAYYVGAKLLAEPQTKADWGELLRTVGFASAPGILRVLGLLPWLGGLLVIVASLWMLVATVIAVREALDYESTGRAVAVCLIGFLVYMALAVVLGTLLGVAGLGVAAMAAG